MGRGTRDAALDAGLDSPPERAYPTPTGEPCPRLVRLDGSVDSSGACYGCGSCLLLVPDCWR